MGRPCKMRKFYIGQIIIVLLIILIFPGCFYYKPALKGRVLDAGTNEPIEGAVAVVRYYRHGCLHGPIGHMLTGGDALVKVEEVLTDEKGEFYIPAYVTIISPLSRKDDTRLVIFKPGYGNFPDYETSPPNLSGEDEEKFFSESLFGVSGTVEEKWSEKVVPVTFGVVKLPKLKTWKERRKASMISGDFPESKCPLMYEMLRKEEEWLYPKQKKKEVK